MKRIAMGLLFVCLLCTFSGCKHEHIWEEASCTTPKKCSECGTTEGEPLGHSWKEATCTEPKTCSRCGVTEGTALGHSWKEATCTEPKTCSLCGLTEGKALGHDAPNVSCTESGTCNRCGAIIEALGHNWQAASCSKPKTCKRCRLTEGEPLEHVYEEVKQKRDFATCTEDGKEVIITRCSKCWYEIGREEVVIPAYGHTTTNGKCARCGEYIFEPIVFSGSGDKVINNINVPAGVYKVVLNNKGAHNFIVHAYKANGESIYPSLANEIGDYEGAIYFDEDINGGIIEVRSSGNWTISFEAISSGGTSNLVGHGDWVSPWFTLKEGALVVTLTHDGSHNFIVHIQDEKGGWYTSLVNEIGSYNGSKVFNKGKTGMKYCIEVKADGNWTIDFGLGDDITKK